jgi:hypothetical protein
LTVLHGENRGKMGSDKPYNGVVGVVGSTFEKNKKRL